MALSIDQIKKIHTRWTSVLGHIAINYSEDNQFIFVATDNYGEAAFFYSPSLFKIAQDLKIIIREDDGQVLRKSMESRIYSNYIERFISDNPSLLASPSSKLKNSLIPSLVFWLHQSLVSPLIEPKIALTEPLSAADLRALLPSDEDALIRKELEKLLSSPSSCTSKSSSPGSVRAVLPPLRWPDEDFFDLGPLVDSRPFEKLTSKTSRQQAASPSERLYAYYSSDSRS